MLLNWFMPMGSTSRAVNLQTPSHGLTPNGAVGEALVRPSKVWGRVVVMADQQRWEVTTHTPFSYLKYSQLYYQWMNRHLHRLIHPILAWEIKIKKQQRMQFCSTVVSKLMSELADVPLPLHVLPLPL